MHTQYSERLLVSSMLLVCAGTAFGQTASCPEWTQLTMAQPAAGGYPTMCYDSDRQVTVRFGGYVSFYSTQLDAETWEYDGFQWRQRTIAGPSARVSAVMAYDSGRRVMVLFGGVVGSIGNQSLYTGETWEYDGRSWTLVTTQGPAPRGGHAMAYDPIRGVVVLYGGTLPNSTPFGVPDGETWEWDGENWALRCTGTPSPRTGCSMVWDPQRSVCVLYGGEYWEGNNWGSAVVYREQWEWNGSAWTRINDNSPFVKSPLLVADTKRGKLLMLGEPLESPLSHVAVWEWDASRGTWFRSAADMAYQPLGRPSVYYGYGITFDQARGTTVLFGGYYGATIFNETWEWDGTRWLPQAVMVPGLISCGMAYDAHRNQSVVFGDDLPFNQTDTWLGRAGGWRRVLPPSSPSPRANPQMAYDSRRRVVVLFGGHLNFSCRDDTWEWDGETWTRMDVSGPPPTMYGAMAYDPGRGVTVLHGGLVNGSSKFAGGDAWEYDGHAWALRPATGPAPGPMAYHAMAYDPERGKIVLVDSRNPTSTWEWDGSGWLKLTAPGLPALSSSRLVHDPTRGQLLLIGSPECCAYTPDVWGLTGDSWTRQSGLPAGIMQRGAVFDPMLPGVLVLCRLQGGGHRPRFRPATGRGPGRRRGLMRRLPGHASRGARERQRLRAAHPRRLR